MNGLGLRFYPSAVLISPSGEVLFKGSPREVQDELIEKHLDGTLAKPVYEWPESLADAATALRAKEIGRAIELASKSDAEGAAEIADALRGMLPARVLQIDRMLATGDYMRTIAAIEDVRRALTDGPEAERLDDLVVSIRRDPIQRRILQQQEKIEKVFERPPKKKKDIEREIEKLDKLRGKFPETVVERDIDRAIGRLRRIRPDF